MNGLVHHLNDEQVLDLFRRAKSILKPGGRVVTLDGCYIENQPSIARKLLDYDHGEYIRNEGEGRILSSRVFESVTVHIRTINVYFLYVNYHGNSVI